MSLIFVEPNLNTESKDTNIKIKTNCSLTIGISFKIEER